MAGHKIDRAQVAAYFTRVGAVLKQPLTLLLLGGASLTWRGLKPFATDVDLGLPPDMAWPSAWRILLRETAHEMGVPADLKDLRQLMPLPDEFGERMAWAFEAGLLRVYHADPYCTALAKLERLRAKDLSDVRVMLEAGLIECEALKFQFEQAVSRRPLVSKSMVVQKYLRDDWQKKFEAFYGECCAESGLKR